MQHRPLQGVAQAQRWACLGRKFDRSGDAIQYLRERDGLSFREACDRLGIRREPR